jgi:hypothetical protein
MSIFNYYSLRGIEKNAFMIFIMFLPSGAPIAQVDRATAF